MTVHIVTDLSYGDSGKGTTVDYLTRQASSTLVVRHNGGPQAAHNVVTDDGVHHTFSQFGSGTLAGAKTFLSRFMLVNPLNMMREAERLATVGHADVWNRTFVDENCVLITPWHVAINRLHEQRRGDSRHGSCGQGVGVTMQQTIDMADLTVRVKHIRDTDLQSRLEALRAYLEKTHKLHEGDSPEWSAIEDQELSQHLVDRYREWIDRVQTAPSERLAVMINEHEQVIFEGAQGVLLDEWYGWHPYTTWSTCTHENALTLLKDVNHLHDVVRLGVIRAVTTRHGPGPHPTEDEHLSALWDEPHNGTGKYQGVFRVGPLDLVAHRYAVKVCAGVDKIVVTHLDKSKQWLWASRYGQIRDIPLGVQGDLELQQRITDQLATVKPVLTRGDTQDLLAAVEENLGPIAITSYGPAPRDKHIYAVDSIPATR